eukprot:2233022-Pyramimonas_sp.AAC.1
MHGGIFPLSLVPLALGLHYKDCTGPSPYAIRLRAKGVCVLSPLPSRHGIALRACSLSPHAVGSR